jgi:integrase
MKRLVGKMSRELKWTTLGSVRPGPVTDWLARYRKSGKSARSTNQYLKVARTFLRWCVRTNRIDDDPLAGIELIKKYSTVRNRRALSLEQLERLLEVSPPYRSLIYLVAAYTGLRKDELRQLRWDNLVDVWQPGEKGSRPRIELNALATKNRKGGVIDLHPRVVLALEKSYKRIVPAAMAKNYPIRVHRSKGHFLSSDPVFARIPTIETFRKDLEKADIPYKDETGRQIDFHGLRYTFGTMLSNARVPPRIAMELMRHSRIDLTMKIYTDATLLPTQEEIQKLPGGGNKNDGSQE